MEVTINMSPRLSTRWAGMGKRCGLTCLASIAVIGANAGAQTGRDAPALSSAARQLVRAVLATSDHHSAPFLVIDKQQARLWVMDPRGGVLNASPILLGLARGDDSVPGIGDRPLRLVRPHERTTPAGRFEIEPGRNLQGEDILWVDYDAAVSMHRVRAVNPVERRLQRLATATSSDNRISFGCINLPTAFYERVVLPLFGSHGGVLYVLPETRALEATFAFIGADAPP
jgi:hypothetical protein